MIKTVDHNLWRSDPEASFFRRHRRFRLLFSGRETRLHPILAQNNERERERESGSWRTIRSCKSMSRRSWRSPQSSSPIGYLFSPAASATVAPPPSAAASTPSAQVSPSAYHPLLLFHLSVVCFKILGFLLLFRVAWRGQGGGLRLHHRGGSGSFSFRWRG